MATNYRHYRDDIRRTFIIYALIPVIIIAVFSYFLLFFGFYREIALRNSSVNTQITKIMETNVKGYQEQADRLSTDVLAYLDSKQGLSELYEVFYNFVNRMDLKANFFVFDNQLRPMLQSSNLLPEYAQGEGALTWGLVGRMLETPDKVVLARPPAVTAVNETLSIGKAIVADGRIAGFITFDMNGADLTRLVSQNSSISSVITDKYGNAIVTTNELLINQFGKIDVKFEKKSSVLRLKADSHYVTRTEILDGEIRIYSITSIGYFSSVFILSGVLLILLFAMLALTIYLSARKIARSKTRVIDDIIKAIENVQAGNLDTLPKVSSNNEFQIFAESYNQMLIKIKDLIEVNKEKARQNVLSEIKQLESQFNPHFLFNTLETIRYMVIMDPSSVNPIIVGLSGLLRYSINNSITEVRLEEDIEYTKNYLLIQKYRFGERFEYNIDVDEQALDCIVPKLIIQPIIENAIKHGFGDRQSLSVTIEARLEGSNLEVTIADDGEGMKPEVLKKMQDILDGHKSHSPHVGLFNVHRRIQLMYGDHHKIRISSEQPGGTVVKITLPDNRGGNGAC